MELKKITLAHGEVLINEGEHSADFFFLVSGELAVFIGTRQVATIDKPGSLIGEMSFFIGEKRSATVIALSDATVTVVPQNRIIDHFTDNPDFAVTVAGSLAAKLRDTSKKVAELRDELDYFYKLKRYVRKHTQFNQVLDEFENTRQERSKALKGFLNEKSVQSKKVLEPLIDGAIYAFKNLTSIEPEKTEISIMQDTESSVEVGSLVNIKGDCEGWYALGFPRDTAFKLTEEMTGVKKNTVDSDVLSMIREINNIMSGQLVTRLTEYSLSITPPTEIRGEGVLRKMVGKNPAIVIRFNSSVGTFKVILSIEIVK